MQDLSLHYLTNVLVNYKKKAILSVAWSPETYRLSLLEPQHHPSLHSDVGEQRQKEMVNKIKFLYNLQPVDKYLRQTQSLVLQESPTVLLLNLTKGKTTLASQ